MPFNSGSSYTLERLEGMTPLHFREFSTDFFRQIFQSSLPTFGTTDPLVAFKYKNSITAKIP